MIASVFTDNKCPVILGIERLKGVAESDGETYFKDGILFLGKEVRLVPSEEGRAMFASFRCTVILRGKRLKVFVAISETTKEEEKSLEKIRKIW